MSNILVVKNIIGTSDNKCIPCGSWTVHWEKLRGQKMSLCAQLGCSKKAELGAHVMSVHALDKSWYIVPLCHTCNKLKGEFTIINWTITARSCY